MQRMPVRAFAQGCDATVRACSLLSREHRGFTRALRRHTQACSDNPDGGRQYVKTAVRAALQEVGEEQRPGCRMVQQRAFVLEKVYSDLYSQLLDSRAMFGEKDVCQMLGGKAGYWVRGSFGNGKLGHYVFEDFSTVRRCGSATNRATTSSRRRRRRASSSVWSR